MMKKNANGFTLLEIMIAIAIFSILMMFTSQLMRSEIKLYGQAVKGNEVEVKARVAMLHVLDQVRLNPNTYYWKRTDGGQDGVYYTNSSGNPVCLIVKNPNPADSTITGSVIYLVTDSADPSNGRLYRGQSLITDNVVMFDIQSISTYMIQIDIMIRDPSTNRDYELKTWVRL